jgi:nucleotide-binding universal stress UspA family protein
MVEQPMNTLSQSALQEVFRLKDILVCTDFSAESIKALSYATAFAQKFNAKLWLIHIGEPTPAFSGLEGIPIIIDDAQLQKNSERRLAEFAAEHIPSNVSVSPLVRNGSAFEEIVSIAKARNIDLIIISTHGRTGLKRILFGSTAERIVQRAPCPVLVVRDREHDFLQKPSKSDGERAIKLDRILAPTDFSDCSKKALQYAIAFAKQFRSEIQCLHVLEILYEVEEAGIAETQAFQKSRQEASKRQMETFVEEAIGQAPAKGEIKLGSPYREIIQMADDRHVDLIIIGTHGRSGLGHFLLGSTTERVVRHARCPVLVVREREHEFIESPESSGHPILMPIARTAVRLLLLSGMITFFAGCKYFVPEYDNPISKRHEKEKKEQQKELKKEASTSQKPKDQ